MSTCRFGHPILVDNYCEFGHIRPIDKPTDEKWNDPRTGPEFDKSTTGEWTVEERITAYLSAGGLFNPELMEHEKVRDLLMDCRAALAAERKRGDEALDWARNIQQDLRETKDQLAAEREACKDAKAIAVKWYDDLAAERETVTNLRIEAKQNWKLIDQLREQQ